MGEVSLETSPKNIMIQDMINSDDHVTQLEVPFLSGEVKPRKSGFSEKMSPS